MKTISFKMTWILSAVILSLTFVSGCGPSKPNQFPDVVPVTLTVLRDGKPLPNIKVKLNYETSVNSALVSGETDDKGVCSFRTSLAEYVADGAPAGKVKVTMSVDSASNSATPAPTSYEEVAAIQAKQRQEQEEARKILPPCVLQLRDTTVTYDIPAEGGVFTVNLEEFDNVEVFVPKTTSSAGPPKKP